MFGMRRARRVSVDACTRIAPDESVDVHCAHSVAQSLAIIHDTLANVDGLCLLSRGAKAIHVGVYANKTDAIFPTVALPCKNPEWPLGMDLIGTDDRSG